GAPLLEGLEDPDPFPAWLTPADLDYFVCEFERSGFRGPINRYRNHRRDFDWLQGFKERSIEQPALFIGGMRDPAFSLEVAGDPVPLMRQGAPNLQGVHVLEGCGHWVQQERPGEVSDLLTGWQKALDPVDLGPLK